MPKSSPPFQQKPNLNKPGSLPKEPTEEEMEEVTDWAMAKDAVPDTAIAAIHKTPFYQHFPRARG